MGVAIFREQTLLAVTTLVVHLKAKRTEQYVDPMKPLITTSQAAAIVSTDAAAAELLPVQLDLF